MSTKWASQPEPIEAQDALQLREQHFDLLPFTARPDIGISLRDVARNVSGLFPEEQCGINRRPAGPAEKWRQMAPNF